MAIPLRNGLRFAALLFLALCAGPLWADGLILDGVGPISIGRGGTNLGFSDNGAILLDNPAAMVNIADRGLYEVGVDTVTTDIHYTDNDPNDATAKVRPFPSPELAYIRRSEDGEFAFGVGVFAPAGFGANYDMQNSVFGPQIYHSLGALGKFLPGVAWRVTDELSIGATVGVGVSYVELKGPFFFQTGPLRGAPTLMNIHETGVAATGSIGLQYQLNPSTVIGLAYTEQTGLKMDGKARAITPLGPSDFDSELDLTWPRSLGIGFKHDLCECRRISCDVIWFNWADAFDNLKLHFTNATNPLFPLLFGPRISDTFPMHWHDTVSLRLGYEWSPTDCDTYRCGYVYHNSPVPTATLNPYTDGVLEHAFSLGYSRQLRRMIFNGSYQYSFSHTRHVGVSEIAGGDFDNSAFRAQVHWVNLGILVPF